MQLLLLKDGINHGATVPYVLLFIFVLISQQLARITPHTIMTNKITTPPTAPPAITPKLLPLADWEVGDVVATVTVLVIKGSLVDLEAMLVDVVIVPGNGEVIVPGNGEVIVPGNGEVMVEVIVGKTLLVPAGVVVEVMIAVVVVMLGDSVQFIPVYPLTQMHSPGCVHLPLIGAIKRDYILLTVDSSKSNLY